jgi:hypothetical protein
MIHPYSRSSHSPRHIYRHRIPNPPTSDNFHHSITIYIPSGKTHLLKPYLCPHLTVESIKQKAESRKQTYARETLV